MRLPRFARNDEKPPGRGLGAKSLGCDVGDFGVESGYDEMKVLRGFE